MKVIGLERGPRLKTADFEPHDELRYFQRQDLRPDPKRQPVTWRPNANARAFPLGQLDYGNQAGGGTVHYGSVSWRLHEDDFRGAHQHRSTLRRLGHSGRLLAHRLAGELCRARALLRQGRARARRVGQGRQPAGQKDRRRQSVRGAAPARLSAAAAQGRSVRRAVRGGRQEARLSPVLDAARDPVAGL